MPSVLSALRPLLDRRPAPPAGARPAMLAPAPPLSGARPAPPAPATPIRVASRAALRAPALALLLLAFAPLAHAEPIGEVDTAFKLLGPNHKVVVEAYDDPKVEGVTCFVSRARTGGISGAVGLAEDKAEASIACRQVGPIAFRESLPKQEEVFSERLSILFKRLRIVRIVDAKRRTLVYLSYSDRLIDGSPKNSLTAVPYGDAEPRTK